MAKDLARRNGMTLGELLNRLILEDEESSSQAGGQDEPTPSPFAPAALSAPPREPYREEPRERGYDLPTRYSAPEHPGDEVGRVADALERLSARIEAAEQRSALAVSGIDHSVRGVISRLDGAEREHVAVAARFEGAVDELKTEQARNAERLRRVEQEAHGPRSAEALKALEKALGRVAGHLYDGENRTRQAVADVEARMARMEADAALGHNRPPVDLAEVVDAVVGRIGERLETAEARTAEAIETLGASFSALDGRIGAVESNSGGADRRLEILAADLSRRMEAARLEMAQKLRESADGRFDRIENRLAEMASHVSVAEQRSAQAIERLGRDVAGIADTLGTRVTEAEKRSATVIEQVGGEMARVASAMEQRVNRADSVQAQALEKLGQEIARITERLTERIANAERRNALAIDDVGEQVARVTERINQRSERANSDLAERIRQSEERTARLLEEARERIDAGLASTQRKIAEQPPAPPPIIIAASQPQAGDLPSPFAEDPFALAAPPAPEQAFSAPEAEFDAPDFEPPAFEAPAFEPEAFPAPEAQGPAFADEDFAAADGFAPVDPAVAAEEPQYTPPEPWTEELAAAEPEAGPAVDDLSESTRPLSTKEIIEQARAAARAAQATSHKKAKPSKFSNGDKLTPLESGGGEGRALFGLGKNRARLRAGSTLQTALVFSGAAAALGAGLAAYYLGVAEPTGSPSARVMQARSAADSTPVSGPEADTTPVRAQAAIAGGAPVVAAPGAPASAPPEVMREAAALYADARLKIEAKNAAGLTSLRRAANLGYTPAQFYLSKLYENGEGGVSKNVVEARRWAERAAEGGDRQAMHNMGLFLHQGQGGPKNATTAALWFRKAADLGLVDSQYNLAQLYEAGSGVPQNAAEAYKWYLIAARAGDSDSKAAATRLRGDLSAEAQATAERSAIAFRAAAPNASQAPRLASADIGGTAMAQRALTRLGYYQGPTDGSASGALGPAIAAYQRDQNLRPTGTLDPETSSKLSVFAR